MEHIGRTLKGLRGKMSLREASEKSGLSHSYIRYLENGKRPGSDTPINPTPDTLRALSKAYDYPYEELMKAAGYIADEDKQVTIEHKPQKEYSPGTKAFLAAVDLSDEQAMERLRKILVHKGEKLPDHVIKELLSFARYKLSHKD